MKNTFLLLFISFFLFGCAEDKTLEINNKSVFVESYGLVNEEAKKRDDVVYQMSPAAVVVSIITVETIVIPVYILGWDLYEPVRMKTETNED